MNKITLIIIIVVVVASSCTPTEKIAKSIAYKGIYDEQPLAVLIMPPINRSTNVEAKEFFHSTLNVPIANCGYYVIPPFLSMEILKQESAYDSEMFIDTPLNKFGEIFGADIVAFTVIHKWDKSGLASNVYVEVEYIIKSVKTNNILYARKGSITYNAAVSTGASGVFGAIADLAASAINTAATKYVDVARACNGYTLKDLPRGKYSPYYKQDGDQFAGQKEFKVTISSNTKY